MTASPKGKWSKNVEAQTRLIYQQIGAIQRLTAEAGGGDIMAENACWGLYQILERLYTEDMVVAKTLDEADLLMRLKGDGLQTGNPRLSLITGIMSDVRKQVVGMIKTLSGTLNESLVWPKEFDLGLHSFEPRNAFFGFSLPEPSLPEIPAGEDPVTAAAEQALETFGEIASLVNKTEGWDEIYQRFPDPKLRDAALSAVGQLAPTGRRGISLVEISARAFKNSQWCRFDPQTRLQVKAWLDRSIGLAIEEVEVQGLVRAIDLDFRRCDIRRSEAGLPDLRCVYGPDMDDLSSRWLNQVIRFRGFAEIWQGQPRLLKINRVVPTINQA